MNLGKFSNLLQVNIISFVEDSVRFERWAGRVRIREHQHCKLILGELWRLSCEHGRRGHRGIPKGIVGDVDAPQGPARVDHCMEVAPVRQLVEGEVDVAQCDESGQAEWAAARVEALQAVVAEVQRCDTRRQAAAVNVADVLEPVVAQVDGLEVGILSEDGKRHHQRADVVEGEIDGCESGKISEDRGNLAPSKTSNR